MEVMGEAEEVLQKLQHLLPQLQELMGLQGQTCEAGAGLFQAHVALLWAMTCMECCGRSDSLGQGLLLAPAVSALPQVRLHCVPQQPCALVAILLIGDISGDGARPGVFMYEEHCKTQSTPRGSCSSPVTAWTCHAWNTFNSPTAPA